MKKNYRFSNAILNESKELCPSASEEEILSLYIYLVGKILFLTEADRETMTQLEHDLLGLFHQKHLGSK